MREIKFRAWDKVIGCWSDDPDNSLADISIKMNGHVSILDDCGTYKPNDFIIEQFTGLEDYNGRDVYEGDILRYDIQDHNGIDHFYENVVVYEGAEFGCKGYSPSSEYWYWHPLNYIFENDIEPQVIGNIHENPDLLNAVDPDK